MRRVNALVLVARPDDDQGVETNPRVKLELSPPLPLRPVLTGNIVGDLVEKSTRDSGERRHETEFTGLISPTSPMEGNDNFSNDRIDNDDRDNAATSEGTHGYVHKKSAGP